MHIVLNVNGVKLSWISILTHRKYVHKMFEIFNFLQVQSKNHATLADISLQKKDEKCLSHLIMYNDTSIRIEKYLDSGLK